MKQKRVLITGAAGFIGSHLAHHLHARGDYVVGVDNFNDYYPVGLKRLREDRLNKEGISIFEGDICSFELMDQLAQEHQITHLINLAAQPGVRYSLVNPQAYLHSNIDGFLSVLETVRKYPSIKLIYASSSSVYGGNKKIPFSITDPTDLPTNLYGVTKKSNELMAQTYHHLFGVSVTGLRFFTVYGPWGRPDMAYFSFTKAIDEGKPIQVHDYEKMERDFTYIDDIIKGTTAAMDLESGCEIFNLGNHKPEKLSTLIGLIEKSLGKKATLIHVPIQPGEVEKTYADIEYSQQKLQFLPKTPLSEGIPRFIEWYKTERVKTLM